MDPREPNKRLTGRVHFNCDFSAESAIGKRKRSAPLNNHGKALVGWIFEPTEDSSVLVTSHSSTFFGDQFFLLSVPHCYESILCDACRFRLEIKIVHYTAVPLFKDTFNNQRAFSMLWIHKQDGALVLPSAQRGDVEDASAICSLEQLCRTEKEYNASPVKSRLYSFRGTVAFISPILELHSKDPFVLVELIQEIATFDDKTHSTECRSIYSVVVVLRKGGLQCASVIAPHHTVVFKNVRKQQWRVPDVLLRPRPKASKLDVPPNSVFVVDSPMQYYVLPSRIPLPMLLSSSIVTFDGVVKSIHFLKYSGVPNGHSPKGVHFLEINTSQRTLTLFVTYYPLSTGMLYLFSLSRQYKTIKIFIRVSNVENLGCNGYAAKLYSHLAILDCADVPLLPTSREPPLLPELCSTFSLSNPRQSYRQLWIRRLVLTSVFRNLRESWLAQHLIGAPSQDEITDQFLSMVQEEKMCIPANRQVYVEFFGRPDRLQRFCTNPETFDFDEVARTSDESIASDVFPLPISLHHIQVSSFSMIKNRLKSYIKRNPTKIRAGWTGSVHLMERSLQQNLAPNVPLYALSSHHFYTLGHGAFTEKNGMLFCSFSNGDVLLPIVFCEKVVMPSSVTSTFVWTCVQTVCVNCVCIGPISYSADEFADSTLLPPYCVPENGTINPCGSCGVYFVNGFVFVISVFLVCNHFQPIASIKTQDTSDGPDIVSCDHHTSILSLEQCLNPVLNNHSEASNAAIVGLLTRSLFRLGKVKNGVYSNYTMTLSHIPKETIGYCSGVTVSSTLQSIEVKPSIAMDTAKVASFRTAITTLIGENHSLSDESLALGVIWWKVSSCPWTCALLGGGWDEVLPPANPRNIVLGAVAHFPASSMHHDSNRGYTRFRGNIDDFVVSMNWMFSPHNIPSHSGVVSEDQWFDHCGLDKFVVGMLDRRPRRRQLGGLAYGELLLPLEKSCGGSSSAGIGRSSLNELTVLLCLDLQSTSNRYHLAPSLVREIQGATFLGISYCRARAECAQCYATLRNPQSHSRGDTNREARKKNHGIKSFPLRLEKSVSNHAAGHGIYSSGDIGATSLTCPNGCRVDLHGTVKWECSGVLDDGRGQAKLYAEREAALCLLGVPRDTVHWVESAIWQTNNADGFVYSKSIPAPSHLREAIGTARTQAIQHIQENGKDARLINDSDVIQFLGPGIYGAYLFHQHCRTSMEPMRELNFYVRCKPLSDSATSWNQCEIEIIDDSHVKGCDSDKVSTTVVQTFSLPPLQLNLVDCGRRSFDRSL